MQSPPTLVAGAVVDRYTIERLLGEGGMAMVFQVRHNGLQTAHALKIITVNNPEIRRRLVQEGELQGRLHHPNVVAVTDIVDVGGSQALVMELVDGPSLDQLLRARRLTLAQADELARGLLAGVAAAHALDLVHRDLKPGNVLLQVTDGGFVPKIADFGLAKVLSGGASRTRTGSTMGTPHYMAPEQIRDSKSVGPAADIFSLGCILYEMVCGVRAFDGDDLLEIFNAIAAGRYRAPRELVPDLPDRMDAAIRAALQTRAEDRPASVLALMELWTGQGKEHASAFDPKTLHEARSLNSSQGDAPPPVAPAPSVSQETWGPGLTRSDDSVAAGPASMAGAPSSSPSSVSAIAVVGLGGGAMVLVMAVIAVLGLLGAGGLAVWWGSSGATTETGPAAVPAPVEVRSSPPPVPEAVPAPTEAAAEPLAPAPAPLAPPPTVPSPPPPSPAEPPVEPSVPGGEPAVVAVVEPVVAAPSEAAPTSPAPVAPPPSDDPELTPFLASPSPAERKKGILNLARRPEDEAVRLLVWELIHEPDSTVRQVAFDAVADRWTARFGDVDELERGMVHMTGEGEVWALPAVRSFARNGQDPRLLSRALHHPSDAVRLAAVEAVATVRPRAPDGVDYEGLLGGLREDPSPAVQRKVNALLASITE